MILFVTLNVDTGNNPTINALTEAMLQNGKELILFSVSRQQFPVAMRVEAANINLHSAVDILIKSPVFLHKFFACLIKYRPEVIIGIDPFGIIVASVFCRISSLFKTCKLHYWSFEMLFKREGFSLKPIEKWACRDLDLLLIQDDVRGKMLCEENGIHDQVLKIQIPVSSAKEYGIKSNALGKQYRIIVWGTIDTWSGMDWIANLEIPDDVSLVIHNRFKIDPESMANKRFASKKNVVLHDAYIEDEIEALDFLSTFDFGLCLYLPQGDNMYLGDNLRYVGLSSGKFSMFAQAGLPIVANNPFQCKLINQYGAGIAIRNQIDLQNFIESLRYTDKTKFLKMRAMSREMFDTELNPKPGIAEYIKTL